jgi:hypothetical protein
MNPFQNIFGGSSGQNSYGSSNFNPLTGMLGSQYGSFLQSLLGQGPMQYGGNLQPGMTGNQSSIMQQLMGQIAPGNPLSQYTNGVLKGNYMPGGPQGNQFLSQNVTASLSPMMEALKTTQSQSNPEAFAGAGQNVQGQGSSAFQNAQSLAGQSTANAAAQVTSNLGSNAYNAGISQMNTAAQVAPQELQGTINTLQAELLPTLIQEQGITNGLSAFQENIGALTSFLGSFTGAMAPSLGSFGSSTNQSQGNAFSSLFGPGAGGNTGIGNFFGMLGSL